MAYAIRLRHPNTLRPAALNRKFFSINFCNTFKVMVKPA